MVGLQREELSFSHPEFHKREATLMSSRNATLSDFNFVIDCLKDGLVDTENYITHSLDFNSLTTQFESVMDVNNNLLKAVIDWPQ